MFDRVGFADKINEFMLLNGYTATTLAETISVSPSTIYNLLQNRYKQPDTEVFFKLRTRDSGFYNGALPGIKNSLTGIAQSSVKVKEKGVN